VQTAIDLIGATTTETGLKVICVRDDTDYVLAKKVSDADFETINIQRIEPFGNWNYLIRPRQAFK
ncbi:MAG: ISAzo13 family transposase, partial [Coriobacteriales bacterium]|nr:ISAzo13 family transposase [Coriobacteriales bacterium]